MEATETATKPRGAYIRPNTSGMEKTTKGLHIPDFIGKALDGFNIHQVRSVATYVGIDVYKYAHLNVGHQRMTIGNRLRGLAKKSEEAKEAIVEIVSSLRAADLAAASTGVEGEGSDTD